MPGEAANEADIREVVRQEALRDALIFPEIYSAFLCYRVCIQV